MDPALLSAAGSVLRELLQPGWRVLVRPGIRCRAKKVGVSGVRHRGGRFLGAKVAPPLKARDDYRGAQWLGG